MHRTGQFPGQDTVYEALALEAREPLKRGGDDFHPEVGFPSGPGPRMALVSGRFVDHLEVLGLQRCLKSSR